VVSNFDGDCTSDEGKVIFQSTGMRHYALKHNCQELMSVSSSRVIEDSGARENENPPATRRSSRDFKGTLSGKRKIMKLRGLLVTAQRLNFNHSKRVENIA